MCQIQAGKENSFLVGESQGHIAEEHVWWQILLYKHFWKMAMTINGENTKDVWRYVSIITLKSFKSKISLVIC